MGYLSPCKIGWGQPYHLEKISGGLFQNPNSFRNSIETWGGGISFSRGKSFVNPIVELASIRSTPSSSLNFLSPPESLFYFIPASQISHSLSLPCVCVDTHTHTNRDDLNAITPRKKHFTPAGATTMRHLFPPPLSSQSIHIIQTKIKQRS